MGWYCQWQQWVCVTMTAGSGHKKSRLESQLFCFNSSARVGSSTVGIGAPEPKLVEHPLHQPQNARSLQISWQASYRKQVVWGEPGRRQIEIQS
jgi:hypothetical protein